MCLIYMVLASPEFQRDVETRGLLHPSCTFCPIAPNPKDSANSFLLACDLVLLDVAAIMGIYTFHSNDFSMTDRLHDPAKLLLVVVICLTFCGVAGSRSAGQLVMLCVWLQNLCFTKHSSFFYQSPAESPSWSSHSYYNYRLLSLNKKLQSQR